MALENGQIILTCSSNYYSNRQSKLENYTNIVFLFTLQKCREWTVIMIQKLHCFWHQLLPYTNSKTLNGKIHLQVWFKFIVAVHGNYYRNIQKKSNELHCKLLLFWQCKTFRITVHCNKWKAMVQNNYCVISCKLLLFDTVKIQNYIVILKN